MDNQTKETTTNTVPILGFGTWQLQGDTATDCVHLALDTGYRHIDTADVYGNHEQVGKGIKNSGIARDDFFLTSKIWRNSLSEKKVFEDTERFLNELQVDYLDLLLIHWPNTNANYAETFQAFAELKKKGRVKNFGVSNFPQEHLEQTLADIKDTEVRITNHQFELHPSLYQDKLVTYCRDENISVTAYSPIAQGQDLNLPVVDEISRKHNISPAQVILSWIMSLNIVAIPKSSSRDHIKDNYDALQVSLPKEDVHMLTSSATTNNRIIDPGFSLF